MTSFNQFTDRNRDQQDGYERGLWGALEYVPGAGAVLKVRGTGVDDGTLDEEVPFLNTGYGFNVTQNYNTEVVLLAMNSDTNQKYAIPSIPRDKQRQWPEGTGGIQHPTNAEKFVQLDDDRIWLRDGSFALGDNQELKITIAGGVVTMTTSTLRIEADLQIDGDVDIVGDVSTTGTLTNNGINVGSTHRHSQAADSNGDTEADTSAPF